MNLEQAVAMTNLRKQIGSLSSGKQQSKTAKEIAELVFDLSAAAGEPYQDGKPEVWAERWLASGTFMLVEIDPRQVAVPYVNKISRTKVLATMEASADSLPPIVVDENIRQIGRTNTGYIPSLIVVDGKHRHRAQILCGRDRIKAWVGERALQALRARAAVRKRFVIDVPQDSGNYKSKVDIAAAFSMGGSPVARTRMDIGDGGSRPTGPSHSPVGGGFRGGPMPGPVGSRKFEGAGGGGASGAAGPGGGVSGLNPERMGMFSEGDPSDRGQMLDPSDKEQFSHGAPKNGQPPSQSPGSGVGPRTRPSHGASNSEMSQREKMLAGPIKVKNIVTDKKKRRMAAVAPPGREAQVMKLKKKFGKKSAVPFKIAWSQENEGKNAQG